MSRQLRTLEAHIEISIHQKDGLFAFSVDAKTHGGLIIKMRSPYRYATESLARRKARVNTTKVLTRAEG